MAKDYLSIGPAPSEENPVQVNEGETKMRIECSRYIELLRDWFGYEPEGARLTIKGFPHDFGTYYEVICYYDDQFPRSVDYAFACEGKAPMRWKEVILIHGEKKIIRLADGFECEIPLEY